jgi:hypothetical protein
MNIQSISLETILALIMGLSTVLLGWKQWKSKSMVESADVAEKIGSAYGELLENMREEIRSLKSRVAVLELELLLEHDWNRRLQIQIKDAGMIPVEKKLVNTDPPVDFDKTIEIKPDQ